MGLVQESDVKRLLQDPELVSDIAKAVVESPGALESIADEIASGLENELGSSSELRKQVIDAAMASPQFKKILALKISAEMEDD